VLFRSAAVYAGVSTPTGMVVDLKA
jgi:hypothetical protein